MYDGGQKWLPAGCNTALYLIERSLKPRPHKQQCRSNIVECYRFNDSFDNVECCFDIVAVFGNDVAGFSNNVERNFILSKGRNFVRHCCRNRQHCCQKATFDFVERTTFYDTRSTLLLVKVGFLYSAAYAITGPARFTISEVAVDWQEPMVLQRKLRPFNCTR